MSELNLKGKVKAASDLYAQYITGRLRDERPKKTNLKKFKHKTYIPFLRVLFSKNILVEDRDISKDKVNPAQVDEEIIIGQIEKEKDIKALILFRTIYRNLKKKGPEKSKRQIDELINALDFKDPSFNPDVFSSKLIESFDNLQKSHNSFLNAKRGILMPTEEEIATRKKFKSDLTNIIDLCDVLSQSANIIDISKSSLLREASIDLANEYIFRVLKTKRNFLKTLGIISVLTLGTYLFKLEGAILGSCFSGEIASEVACAPIGVTARKKVPETWEGPTKDGKAIVIELLSQWVGKDKERIRYWLEEKGLSQLIQTAENFFLMNKDKYGEKMSFDDYMIKVYFPNLIFLSDKIGLDPIVALQYYQYAGGVQGWFRAQKEIIDEKTGEVIQKARPIRTNRDVEDSQKQVLFGALQTWLLRETGQSDLADLVQFASQSLPSQYSKDGKVGVLTSLRAPLISIGLGDEEVEHMTNGLISFDNARDILSDLRKNYPEVIGSLIEVFNHRTHLENARNNVRFHVGDFINLILIKGQDGYSSVGNNPLMAPIMNLDSDFWDKIGLGKKSGVFDMFWQLTHWTTAAGYYSTVERSEYWSRSTKMQYAIDKARESLIKDNGQVRATVNIFRDQLENPSFRRELRLRAKDFPDHEKAIVQILDSYDQLFSISLDHRDLLSNAQNQLMKTEYDLFLQIALHTASTKYYVDLITKNDEHPLLKRCSNNPYWQAFIMMSLRELAPFISLIEEEKYPRLSNVDTPKNPKFVLDWLEQFVGFIEKTIKSKGREVDDATLLRIVAGFFEYGESDVMVEVFDGNRYEYQAWSDYPMWSKIQEIRKLAYWSGIYPGASMYFDMFEEHKFEPTYEYEEWGK